MQPGRRVADFISFIDLAPTFLEVFGVDGAARGMAPVTGYLDVMKLLKRLPLSPGKDYLAFLDSTMARFWFFNDKAKTRIKEEFSQIEQGRFLTPNDLHRFHIDKLGKEHGEAIFVVDEGIGIHPDFFHRCRRPKGLHGYAFPHHDSPVLIISSPGSELRKKETPVEFIDLMPTVLGMLGLPVPSTCEGTSLLRKD